MRPIENIIIHHSASIFGSVDIFRKWHKGRGWRDIGYNAVILNGRISPDEFDESKDGVLEVGRGLDFDKYISSKEKGAHALGYNSNSIGICLVGDGVFSARQMDTLKHLLKVWRAVIPSVNIIGHRDVNSTSCPGFDVEKWLKQNKI
jgi:hypothetical protein